VNEAYQGEDSRPRSSEEEDVEDVDLNTIEDFADYSSGKKSIIYISKVSHPLTAVFQILVFGPRHRFPFHILRVLLYFMQGGRAGFEPGMFN
jgi:hypothetical protein